MHLTPGLSNTCLKNCQQCLQHGLLAHRMFAKASVHENEITGSRVFHWVEKEPDEDKVGKDEWAPSGAVKGSACCWVQTPEPALG